MRKVLATLFSAATIAGLLAFAPARAAAPVVIEKSLLGVRILGTYHDVYQKFGQPHMVLRAGELFHIVLDADAAGNQNGGVKDILYNGSSGGGASGGGGGPTVPGGKGGVGPSVGPASGGMSGAGGPGGAGGSEDESDVTFAEAGAYIWIYKYPEKDLAYGFVFNLQGRVLLVIEYGKKGGLPTQRGLKLGDSLKSLYEIYGWPDTIQEQPPALVLDYGSKYHAKFAIIKDKIVGVAVTLEEHIPLRFYAEDSASGGGGGGGKGGAPSPMGAGGGGGPKAGPGPNRSD